MEGAQLLLRNLAVETQVFWRRGGPPQQADVRTPASQ